MNEISTIAILVIVILVIVSYVTKELFKNGRK